MSIHELGYRGWEGRRTGNAMRWWVLAESGIVAAWKSTWLRRILFFAWIPALLWGALFFFYEQRIHLFTELGQTIPPSELRNLPFEIPTELVRQIIADPEAARSDAWAFGLLTFFLRPQSIGLAILIGLVAPPLIARDLRTRAFLLYFARPITRIEYLLGKSFTVWFFTAMITTLPALLLFFEAVMLSSELSVLADTWHLPLRLLVASAVLIVPTTAVALCFSSLTRENRYASFGWFAVWINGEVAYRIFQANGRVWPVVAPHRSLGELQKCIFGFPELAQDVGVCAGFWVVVTPLAFAILYGRISAPMRA